MTTSTEPKYLYHYTSQKGLLGILQTNKLWMTDILYLNDSSEFIHTLELVKSELGNRINQLLKKGIPAIFKWENVNEDVRKYEVYSDLQSDYDFAYSGLRPDIYVFSFSRKKNDLSQWRGYCPKGIGFCIEFETNKLSYIIKKKKCRLTKCVYSKKEKDKIIKSLIDDLESLFESNSKNKLTFDSFRTQVGDISDKRIIEFLHYHKITDISSYIKHKSFKNENEYRIVKKGESNETKYRQGNSMIVPYIEMNLSDNGKLPISKIIVGPTPHPELSKLSVKSLLKAENYDGVEVEISEIPYRSW